MYDIDFVIPTVDGTDPIWQKKFIQYKALDSGLKETDISMARYRKGVDLRYWFRGVEKYAPWVRKVHFITDDQLPDWLNLDCPKLHWVKHTDIIPEKFLPIFNSNCLDVSLHRINGLAEHFVYFNDDMFLTDHVTPERFFVNGTPTEMAVLQSEIKQKDIMKYILANNIRILNKSFRKWDCLLKHPQKWFSLKYRGLLLSTLQALPGRDFVSFWEHHFTHSYLKETFNELWELYEDELYEVCSHRFRHTGDLNQWLFAYWQQAKGNFVLQNFLQDSKPFYQMEKDIESIEDTILNNKYKMILLNDSNDIKEYDKIINRINSAFEKVLPNKSSFEK